jgi:hypothetical protein
MTSRAYVVALSVSATAGAVIAGASVLAGRGTFEYRMLAIASAFAGVLLIVLAVVLHAIARRRGPGWIRRVACVTAVVGVLGVSQVESWVGGIVMHERDLRAARAHGEQVVARMEQLRAASGRYPMTIEDAGIDVADPPYLWRRSGVFNSSGDDFVISFSEADAVLPHVVQYSSASSRWERF